MTDAYPEQPRITLVCPPELKTRLMLRLSNWATDATGQLDPGIDVHIPQVRDRDEFDLTQEGVIFSLALGLFAAYGDPPFTGDGGKMIEWWRAPWAYRITANDLDHPHSAKGTHYLR